MKSNFTTLSQAALLLNSCAQNLDRIHFVNKHGAKLAAMVEPTGLSPSAALRQHDCEIPDKALEILTERIEDFRLSRKAMAAKSSSYNSPIGVH